MKSIIVALTLIVATTTAAFAIGVSLATSHNTLEASALSALPASCHSLAGCHTS